MSLQVETSIDGECQTVYGCVTNGMRVKDFRLSTVTAVLEELGNKSRRSKTLVKRHVIRSPLVAKVT